MRYSILKYIRVIFSGIVILCFLFVFLDLEHIVPGKWSDMLVSLQFVSSIIEFLDIKVVVSAAFIWILVLTLLTGRTYCSFLCPLGIVQDINSRLGGKIKKKFKRYGYRRPHTVIRYSILVFVLVMTLFSGVYVISLLDPFSIFGRSMTFFIKPLFSVLNNFFVGVLERFDLYPINRVKLAGYPLVVYTIPVAFFVLVATMSLIKGRLYCNTVCPVGSLLGLVSKLSVFRIKVDSSKCSKCGRCAVSCKASCIDFMKNEIDVSRCVNCFNCIKTCPERGISYGFVSLKKSGLKTTPEKRNVTGRRDFIIGSAALFFGTHTVLKAQELEVSPNVESSVEEERNYPVCPPGAVNMERFNSLCTACSLCMDVCPTNVLRPSLTDYGFWGMMQPVMDYSKGFCAYECNACTNICPTNALSLLSVESKKYTQVGVAHFIKDNCVVKLAKTACGACSDVCPTKAVYMVPYEGKLRIPEIDRSLCIGCGHCENVCPMVPFKAIYVDGFQDHKIARVPVNVKSSFSRPKEFPF